MRYFDIVITDSKGTALDRWRSHDENGTVKDGFLRVEINAQVSVQSQASSNTSVKIWGVPLKYLSQKYNMNGMKMEVYGGMAKGLPIANEAQRGLLFRGEIIRTYPMWENTSICINFIAIAYAKTKRIDDKSFIFKWSKGQKLSDAIKQTFLDISSIDIRISDQLVNNFDEIAHFSTIQDFGRYIKQRSKSLLILNNYTGVDFAFENEKLIFTDNTVQQTKKAKIIDFKDFIGQPTWQHVVNIDVRLVMRGDLMINDVVNLPDRLNAIYNPEHLGFNQRDLLSFTGDWIINTIQHVGDSRNLSGDAWVTMLNLTKTSKI